MHWSDEIIKEYQKFYRLAFAYVRNEQDAMDVVQEAYLRALKGASRLKKEEYALTWFHRIVINTALTFLKKRSKSVSIGELTENNTETMEASYQDTWECHHVLGEAVDALPVKYRNIIVLRFISDKKLSEIADILQISENTVKTRLYSALRKLRIDLKESGLEGTL
jgi:RNA polymerase sigma-70 factor (ECF subfamily)